MSTTNNGTLGGLVFADEDIIRLDQATGAYTIVFDGSDVGITSDVDAFDFLPDGSLLLSLNVAASVSGIGTADDSDIVRFVPASLGPNTAGNFEWYFDGSDVGLATAAEDVDALAILPDGRLVVSTNGSFAVSGVSGVDEDLIAFTPRTLGTASSGTWSLYFDGSDVGLSASSENVIGLWIAPGSDIYLVTTGSFTVTGISGNSHDIFVFRPTTLGAATSGTFRTTLYLDGSAYGLSSFSIDAIHVVP